MNSGPTAFAIVSETIRSISAAADASICQPERPVIGASWSGRRAPQSATVLSCWSRNPAQCEMNDALSVVGLREAVEPLNRSQILRKTGSLELGIVLSQIIARKLRLSCHAAGAETPTQGPVGEGDDVFVPTIREDVVFDGAFKQIVGRLHRLHRCNLAEGLDLRRIEIADADYPNLAGAVQVGHRSRDFLDRYVGIGPMHLIDVDGIGPQPP